ncbi:EpsG family protein, partial [Lactobacillus delbrueckii subsp. bulgaricus]
MLKNKDTEDSIYTNVHFVGVLCSILLLGIPGGDRIFAGFRFIELLSVPNLLYKLKLRKISYIILSLVIAVL